MILSEDVREATKASLPKNLLSEIRTQRCQPKVYLLQMWTWVPWLFTSSAYWMLCGSSLPISQAQNSFEVIVQSVQIAIARIGTAVDRVSLIRNGSLQCLEIKWLRDCALLQDGSVAGQAHKSESSHQIQRRQSKWKLYNPHHSDFGSSSKILWTSARSLLQENWPNHGKDRMRIRSATGLSTLFANLAQQNDHQTLQFCADVFYL